MDWQTTAAIAIVLASAALVARHMLRPFLNGRNRPSADDSSGGAAPDREELVQISPADDSS